MVTQLFFRNELRKTAVNTSGSREGQSCSQRVKTNFCIGLDWIEQWGFANFAKKNDQEEELDYFTEKTMWHKDFQYFQKNDSDQHLQNCKKKLTQSEIFNIAQKDPD